MNFFDDENFQDKKIIPIDVEKTCDLISTGGFLDRISEDFEQRDSQIQLLANICDAFNDEKIGIFEAGTGVGKSFAYLIPALIWASTNKERIIISTGTINLQQQIFEKDLPLAEKITGKKVKTFLVKGRQNFICLRRFSEFLKNNDLFTEEIDEITKIKDWIEVTNSGSKSDLQFSFSNALWQQICSESDSCLGNRCSFKNKCFVMKMKKKANESQVIIVNHHLLFADIQMRVNSKFSDTAILPAYKRLIFDEAHGIENAATSFFSQSFTKFKIQKHVRQLYRNLNGNQSGLYFSIETLSTTRCDISKLIEYIAVLDKDLQLLDENAKILLTSSYTFRLSDKTVFSAVEILESFRRISMDLQNITGFMNNMINALSFDDRESDQVFEARSVIKKIEECTTFCNNFIEWEKNRELVFWIENGKYIHYNETPIDISDFLYHGVFEQMKTVVCTSATLSIANSFNYWLSRVGINYSDNERIICAKFDSPFPYHKNVLFSVPTDAPLPENKNFQNYIDSSLPGLIVSSFGRTLVLFTSYESLKQAYQACSISLKDNDFKILKQGDEDRFKLLENFKNDISSTLFATYSFWEGIDVPGESLSHVIIVKLPFGVPSDPVFASKCENIEARGGSSFMELSIPEAIIKFRQGFGRLLRKNSDYGVVTVLDKRLIEKYYGQIFLQSIPSVKNCIDTTAEICKRIENFLS
ncbi:MAG: ATP-dependent DNA helicase [Treponemataceae bacterium]